MYKSLTNRCRKITFIFHKISIQKIMILTLTFIITFSALIIAGISYTLSEKIIHRKTLEYTTDILGETSNNISTKLAEIDNLTTYICCNTTIQAQIKRLNFADSNSQIYEEKRILEKELINMTVANDYLKETTIITSTYQAAWLSQPTLNFPPESDVYRTLDNTSGGLCWITILDDDAPQIVAGRIVNDLGSQQKLGYLLVRFDTELLLDMLSQKKLFEAGLVCIIDENGTIIASNQETSLGNTYQNFHLIQSHPSPQKLKQSNEWLTYCSIPGTSWKLVSSIPSVAYEREIIQLRNYIVILSLIIVFLSIVIAARTSKLIFQPIKNLCKIMPSVGQGNFDVIEPSQYQNEIGELYNYFFNMVQDIQTLIYKTKQQQQMLQKTELNSLRMQINPHFIYNTLESIKWIAYMEENEEIVTMVKALGDFMRSSISGSEFISVEKELDNIQCYLTIQKFRYGDKLSVKISIPEELYQAQIPKLLLQPLIENAMVHGLEQKMGNGVISISGFVQNSDLYIDIIDNGIGFSCVALEKLNAALNTPNDTSVSFGLGMRNVHQRIQMYYGEIYGLKVTSQYGVETRVQIHIPFVLRQS